jgi:hypothetical protein
MQMEAGSGVSHAYGSRKTDVGGRASHVNGSRERGWSCKQKQEAGPVTKKSKTGGSGAGHANGSRRQGQS